MFTCNICMEERMGDIGNQCCGLIYCSLCCLKSRGLCYVCDKDQLNWPNRCSICAKSGNALTILECMNINCFQQVCEACNSKHINGSLTFCSIMCNFHAYLSFRDLEVVGTIQQREEEEEECRQE